MEESQPRIAFEQTPEGRCVRVQGRWTAESLSSIAHWESAQADLAALPADWQTWHWDLRALQRFDHTGAQLLWNSWHRQWPDTLQASPAQRAMLERVAKFSSKLPPRRISRATDHFLHLGAWVMGREEHVLGAVRLIGQLLLDVVQLVRHPRQAPWRDISGHIYRIGATALPITALLGFLIGVVLAYLMSQQLRQFGADAFIVNILGISLIRELGPVLAAILIAGRSGSAITAQIGVMRVTEELDAMQAKAVLVSNLWLAVAKSAVFGLMIALIGCHYGLRVLPNTQSLGEGTTTSVVTSITMVVLVDALFAVVFKDVGI